MFRTFATIVGGPNVLFRLHPADLILLCELAWDSRSSQISPFAPALGVGHPFNRSELSRSSLAPALPGAVTPLGLGTLIGVLGLGNVRWPHLIYAYMIENTRIHEVFRRVVHELRHGEKLGVPSDDTLHWLRSTEELFYRDAPSFFVSGLHSPIRPDNEATRRSTYDRLLGMDLNHGTTDSKPYPFLRADATNKEFVSTFEELLREVWIGIVNASNFTGAKPTDDAKLRELTQSIQEMLLARRLNGNLSREEFAAVTMMSWFHLTVETETPIITDLRADATSPAQRLLKIAQAVGVPAHGLSASFFDIAQPIEVLLRAIELGFFELPGAEAALYTPGGGFEPLMRTIITHWSIVAGRDMKSTKLVPMEAARRRA